MAPDDIKSSTPGQKHPRARRPTANKTSSNLLANVNFERKNKPQPRLPPNHKIQKRPITHPPIASPYAGSEVQKVVYVSRHTPIMAAVKRVKNLLEQAEKRNLQRAGILGTRKRAGNLAAAAKAKNRVEPEVILVKGSGRAMDQAAKVGEWFKRHGEDGDGEWVVNIRPASVKVIDDIIQDSPSKSDDLQAGRGQNDDNAQPGKPQQDPVGSDVICAEDEGGGSELLVPDRPSKDGTQLSQTGASAPEQKGPTSKKRKRPMYDEGNVPEARTRYIHVIEIAISLKG